MAESRVITWQPFFNALKEAGLLPHPEKTTRIVIDAKVGDVCRIYYETYGDERIAKIGPDALIPADNDPVKGVVQ